MLPEEFGKRQLETIKLETRFKFIIYIIGCKRRGNLSRLHFRLDNEDKAAKRGRVVFVMGLRTRGYGYGSSESRFDVTRREEPLFVMLSAKV